MGWPPAGAPEELPTGAASEPRTRLRVCRGPSCSTSAESHRQHDERSTAPVLRPYGAPSEERRLAWLGSSSLTGRTRPHRTSEPVPAGATGRRPNVLQRRFASFMDRPTHPPAERVSYTAEATRTHSSAAERVSLAPLVSHPCQKSQNPRRKCRSVSRDIKLVGISQNRPPLTFIAVTDVRPHSSRARCCVPIGLATARR